MLAHGATPAEVCRQLDVKRNTFDHWQEKDNFKAAIDKRLDVFLWEKVVKTAHRMFNVIAEEGQRIERQPSGDERLQGAVLIWDKTQAAMKRLGAAHKDDGVKVRALNITFTTREGIPPPAIDAQYVVKEDEPSGEGADGG